MKKHWNTIQRLGTMVAALALFVGVSSSNSACYFWFNQPKMPERIEKFRK